MPTIRGAKFTPNGLELPSGCITNAMIVEQAGIPASKLQAQQGTPWEAFPEATTVAAAARVLGLYRAAGEIVEFEAVVTGAIATGADRTVTVDLQRSRAGGAFASVLSGTIVLDDGSTLRVPVGALFAATDLIAGDLLRAVVTVAGAAGAQATGLLVNLWTREMPS